MTLIPNHLTPLPNKCGADEFKEHDSHISSPINQREGVLSLVRAILLTVHLQCSTTLGIIESTQNLADLPYRLNVWLQHDPVTHNTLKSSSINYYILCTSFFQSSFNGVIIILN